MQRIGLLAIPFLLASAPALAADVDGNGALSLAAIVAQHSPLVKGPERVLLFKLLNGQKNAPYGEEAKVTVAADALTCKAGNVDITLHSCELTFGTKKVKFEGRGAHELYATLVEVGVPTDGAAGTIFEAVSNLKCEIDPAAIRQTDGSGAHCSYDPSK